MITHSFEPNGNDEFHGDPDINAKVVAARMRLPATVDQADALEAVWEIVANLLGSEELAIFKVDTRKASLWLHWSFGVDPNKYAMFDLHREPVLAAVVRGKMFLRISKSEPSLLKTPDPVNALIPVFRSGKTVGVLVIFRPLSQKEAFVASDIELCKVLASSASRALDFPAAWKAPEDK